MERKRLNSKYIPWMIVMFFVVLACIDGIFVYMALSTHPGVRVENSYEKGIKYNETLSEYQKQKEMGIIGNFEFLKDGKLIDMKFSLKDKNNQPLTGYLVSAKISRPTHKGYDNNVKFEILSNGMYGKKLEFPLAGQWDVYIYAEKDGNIFRITKRINIE